MPQYTVEDLIKIGAKPAAVDIPPIKGKSYSVEDLMKMGARPAAAVAGTLDYKQETARRQFEANKPIPSAMTGLQNLGESIVGAGTNVVKGIGHQIVNWGNATEGDGSPSPMPFIHGVVDPPVDYVKALLNKDPDAAARAGGTGLVQTAPVAFSAAKAGKAAASAGAEVAQSAATEAGWPTAFRRAAEKLRANAKTPSLPTSTTAMAIARTIIKGTATPLARASEVVADWMSTPEGKMRTMKALHAAEAESKARIQSLQPIADTGGPTGAVPTPPGVSAIDQGFLNSLREEVAIRQRVADAKERAYANRNTETPRKPSESKAPPPAPGVSSLNQEFIKNPPSVAVATPPEFINKWMNVPSKEVLHGGNPGAQLLEERLIGATKEATKVNVDTALKDAGLQMNAKLKAAGAKGITIDAQTPVYDATTRAVKRIGSPKDSTFTAQINGIVDDIEARYPDLSRLSPEQAHALKVDLGEAIRWNGEASSLPANQAMIEIYRDLNKLTKVAVPDIAAIQDRWANLYIASKSLRSSLAKDIAGSGTGSVPKPELWKSH